MTTKTFKAVLFIKEDCLPCALTKDCLESIREEHPSYGNSIHILKREYHPSLVGAYSIEKFPTLVIVDQLGEEEGKLIGGQAIRDHLKGILFTLTAIQ